MGHVIDERHWRRIGHEQSADDGEKGVHCGRRRTHQHAVQYRTCDRTGQPPRNGHKCHVRARDGHDRDRGFAAPGRPHRDDDEDQDEFGEEAGEQDPPPSK
jgi:hypothetical protein